MRENAEIAIDGVVDMRSPRPLDVVQTWLHEAPPGIQLYSVDFKVSGQVDPGDAEERLQQVESWLGKAPAYLRLNRLTVAGVERNLTTMESNADSQARAEWDIDTTPREE
jgi:hypothetical protein